MNAQLLWGKPFTHPSKSDLVPAKYEV
jgi:hypothetical protein